MTNKKFKLAAMSLATAVAVSTVGPSASAVTYYLGDGSVTVDKDGDGAYSYQGTDIVNNRTYVNKDEADKGTIYVQDGHKPTETVPPTTDNSDNGTVETTPADNATQSTDASGNNEENNTTTETTTTNTITVMEDVEKTNKADGTEGYDVKIVVDGVNVDTSDTSTPAEAAQDTGNTEDKKTIIKVGEGADVDLTVMDSNLTTGGNGIDIGVNLDGKDENKETNVDLTLDNTQINLTQNGKAGINVQDNSNVDLTLKDKNTIDGSEAIKKEEDGILTKNVNVEGIRVGDGGASDGSGTSEGADTKLTISGGVEKTETAETDTEETESSAGGSLTISDTTGGLAMADGSHVEITDGADVTIEDTKTSGATQAGRAVTQHGDLTISGGSSLTINGVEDNAKQAPHTGIGIASWDNITVKDGSTLDISNTEAGIYGHQGSDASLTVEDSTLNIDSNGRGIDYEGGAGDITFDNSEVNISGNGMGISVAPGGGTNITFDNSTGSVSAQNGTAIYGPESNGKGKLTVTNKSEVKLEAPTGIYAGFDEVEISGKSKITSIGSVGMMFVGGQSGATKLHVTGESEYNLQMKGYAHALRVNLSKNPSSILVDQNSKLHLSQATKGASAIVLGNGATLTMDNGTLITEGNFLKGIYSLGSNSTTTIRNGSHVDVNSIVGTKSDKGQNLIVTGGTLTYDYKADNTLWPVNEQGDKLTNFLLTKDDTHANFDALSYNGQTYTYLSDLNKETGKQYLSVWVPAAALNYMLDVDGSHDPEIIGKALEELKQAGYNFDTAYQTAENGDQVVILRDMVVNGKSLNFTKTTDAEGNTKLIWGNYEKQAEGAPSAYDMVYGTEYEYEGKTYTIVWGYESQNNPNTTAAAGVLDAFGPDSNVKVTGDNIDGTDSAQYTVTIYGALREVTDPVIPTNPEPETPEDSDPTPPAPTTPTTPAVQDTRPTTPAVEQAVAKTTPAPETPVNPPVQDARPESGKLIQTGTTNWMADVLVRAGGVLLAAGYLLERKRKSMFHKAQH